MNDTILEKFKELFKTDALLFRSPGRINLLGEHIDYNDGIVLPAGIDKYIYMAIQNRSDDEIHLYSMDYKASFQSSLTNLVKSDELWPNYILGVVDQFKKEGEKLQGFNLVFSGTIPQGAGMSSSAALECAIGFALQDLNESSFENMELAELAQRAEHEFVGVKCGLMDQFASVFAKRDHFIKFDTQSLAYSYLPFESEEYSFLLLDSKVKHSLASSAYNERREQCEEGLRVITSHLPAITSFRQVTLAQLDQFLAADYPILYRRCNFVVKEMGRVEKAGSALLKNDFKTIGNLLFETHKGLSENYEVSCEELDFLVEKAKNNPHVLGARMMGGGFGGCTLNLIRKDKKDEIIQELTNLYHLQFSINLKSYAVNLSDGTEKLN